MVFLKTAKKYWNVQTLIRLLTGSIWDHQKRKRSFEIAAASIG